MRLNTRPMTRGRVIPQRFSDDSAKAWGAHAITFYGTIGSIFAMILCAGLGLGCGVKKSPVAPRHKTPPPIEHLDYRIDESSVSLSWTLPATTDSPEEFSKVVCFRIYRSTVALPRPTCTTCPVVFMKIARVPMPSSHKAGDSGGVRMTYREIPRPGFNYMYKVTACDARGNEGPASNIVEFVFE